MSLDHEKGLVALREGDLRSAAACARRVVASGEAAGLTFFHFIGWAMLALVDVARTDAAAARDHIARARGIGDAVGSSLGAFLCELCEAELARQAGDLGGARGHLARALRLSREKGVLPDVWFSRPQLAELCAVALDADCEPEAARALVRRLGLEPPASAVGLERWPWPVEVRVLGELAVTVGGRPLRGSSQGHRRPLELLALLASSGRRESPEHAVEDALWPEARDAHHALETTLHRLRRLLGERAVRWRDHALSLDPRWCWTDATALAALLDEASARLGRLDLAGATAAAERALRLYGGPLLDGREEPWVLSARDRLRRRLQRSTSDFARLGAVPTALAEAHARAVERDPALAGQVFT